ncbi:MAG: hypothetical protein QOG80_1257, partial [Pseudonocardiales bacterium]|nr:hypothetical protein [Pseudonocardiales bacterium]
MISRAFTSGRRMVVVGVLMLASALVLAACGGGSSGSGSTSPAAASATAGAAGGGAAGGGAGRPGAAGQIAAITGTTMQVQSQQAGQVGVSWTASTTFSHPVTTTLSAIKAGDCVVATAPTGSSSTSFTATALSVTTPVNGQCGGGAGGPGGQRPTGQRPSGAPSGGFGQRTGAFATGTVSSVSGSTLVIAA